MNDNISMRNNQNGFSLVEITISMALVGMLALVVVNYMNMTGSSYRNFDVSSQAVLIEKQISSYVLTNYGCEQIKSLKAGDTFVVRKAIRGTQRNLKADGSENKTTGKVAVTLGEVVFEPGMEMGAIRIDEMQIEGVRTLDTANETGIMTLEVVFLAADKFKRFSMDSKEIKKQIYVPVAMNPAGEVTDCLLDKTQMYTQIINKLCGETFGSETNGMSCEDAILYVEEKIRSAICEDITSVADNPVCNFKLSYANKKCRAGQFLVGFDATGDLICR